MATPSHEVWMACHAVQSATNRPRWMENPTKPVADASVLATAPPFSFLASTPRPYTTHKLAILFPSEKVKPKFVWVGSERSYFNEDHVYRGVHLDREDHQTEAVYVTAHLQRRNPNSESFAFQHSMDIYVRDECELDGSPENLSIRAMMKGTNKHLWKGPILAVSQAPASGTNMPVFYQDVTCADLPTIASKADLRVHGKSKLSEIDVRRNFPVVFRDLKPTSISKHMGLPIIVAKQGNIEQLWRTRGLDYNPNQNRSAVFLNIITDPDNWRWGVTDLLEWDTDIGGVLVVRQDKKDITPGRLRLLQASVATWSLPEAKKKIVKTLLCRTKFEEYFKKIREEKIAAGDGAWEDVVSPYET
ncbi:uncharacterized protein PAC_13909 [Phialocephala subalpina]|uniref:Uncharacterized protein n=1 Tax=Phialocephala subalpina TaxID=576137 RepID=A0A1L7XG61_9HELO|nr:uncharacterized protein PAC_13909 [Phialocephala subalpina]